MNILIIGSGGREHALAWKAAQSNQVKTVYVAPGNAGTQDEPKCKNVPIESSNITDLLKFALGNQINLTIVGPEAPLVAGIVDEFKKAGLLCFGPDAKAAQLEGSKTFSKKFLEKYQIPNAKYKIFSNRTQALQYLSNYPMPAVIKADGLANGKGVVIAYTHEEAKQAVTKLFQNSNHLVIEEFIKGEEASFIVMVDGEDYLPLATSQDYKARYDNNTGPNTGGMGAYSPAPAINENIYNKIIEAVIKPTLSGLTAEGIHYTGFLYVGLMISKNNTPFVLEFNCRLGDPETQPILMRLESDFVDLILSACLGNLDRKSIKWKTQSALGVVMVSKGYPGAYSIGNPISGLDRVKQSNVKIFHAGTKYSDNHIVTNGGRVLCVTALANDLKLAQDSAYSELLKINFFESDNRKDIGAK